MEYSIRQLSDMAGISTRTLRYYDQIGLLKPTYADDAGCRFYGEKEVDLLQQILFYRVRKFSLKQIGDILNRQDFDILTAMQEHLSNLERQQQQIQNLIHTISQTISSIKGENRMKDKEKFEAFKKYTAAENEKKYGEEIREKYGDEKVEASNRKLLNMTEEEYKKFTDLEHTILEQLQKSVLESASPESETGKEIFELHKEWISMAWGKYSSEAHKGIAAMYVGDERFRSYYDKERAGCANFLEKAIHCFAE